MNKLTKKYLNFDKTSANEGMIAVIFDELIGVISYHNRQYYELASPEISDGEYDILFSLLKQLEQEYPEQKNPNSPTLKIWTASLAEWFTKAEHPIPLISLSNSYNTQDLLDRDKQLKRIAEKEWLDQWSYNVDPKLDGSSVEIVYRKGQYVQAITRWDGTLGEDITNNVSKLRNIPLYIKAFSELDEVRLRWEIVLPINSFETINKELIKSWDAVFANPRNAAAWTLRQLDSQVVYERGLVIFIYDVLSGLTFEKQEDQMQYLIDVWIPVHAWKKYGMSLDQVINICKDSKVISQLESDNIEMDWLVIKVNDMKAREIFGSTEHHPRRAMAFKFPTKQVAAKILDITYQVGRTGAITPVAELDPVSLGWVTIARATLHNFDYITDRDIRKGDRVRVQRSGEVIPYIIGPIVKRRDGSEEVIWLLEFCPTCSTRLIKTEGEVALLCPSDSCEAKLVQQIQHFVSKNCLNISWIWDSLVELLVHHSYLSWISDLYLLENKGVELKALQWIWVKKIASITQELQESKNKELRRWIHGFGIKFVWKKISQDLSRSYAQRLTTKKYDTNTGAALLTFFQDEQYLNEVFWLGKQTIQSLWNRAASSQTQIMINQLSSVWVTFSVEPEKKLLWEWLLWKSFVITWSFEWYTRDSLGTLITDHGWTLVSSISSKTSYLLAGEKAWSKLSKAKDLDVNVINLDELAKLIWGTLQKKKSTNKVVQWGLF